MPTCQQVSNKADAHSDAIWCVEWLSDDLLLTGGVDGALKLWEIKKEEISAQPIWTAEAGEFQMGVVSICRLADRTRFAATSMDGCIRVYEAQEVGQTTFKLTRRIQAGPVDCWTLCASADGSEIASGTSTGAINLWDVETGRLRKTLETHGTFVLSVARFQDTIAVGSRDGSVFFANLLTGEVLATASRFHQLPVRALKFSKDGTRLYTASDDGLASVITVPGGEKVGVFKGALAAVLGVAVAEQSMATASADRRVRIWNLETRECTNTFESHSGQVFAVAFSPSETLLVSADAAGELQLYTVS